MCQVIHMLLDANLSTVYLPSIGVAAQKKQTKSKKASAILMLINRVILQQNDWSSMEKSRRLTGHHIQR
jgi:hypothetical protein